MPDSSPIPQHLILRWKDLVNSLLEVLSASAVRLVRLGKDGDIALASAGAALAHPITRDGLEEELLHRSEDRFDGAHQFVLAITGPDGARFGALEIISHAPAGFSDLHLRLARQLRAAVEDQLALHRVSELSQNQPSENAAPAPADPGASADAPAIVHPPVQVTELRFRQLVESSMDDYFIHDESGRFIDVNEHACTSLGYTREELLELSVPDISCELVDGELDDNLETASRAGSSVKFSARHRRKDGTSFPVEVMVTAQIIGGQRYFLGMARDITEQAAAKKALVDLNAELEERVTQRTSALRFTTMQLRAIMDNVPDALSLTDAEGRFLLVNPMACSLLQSEPEFIVGRTIGELLDPETAQRIRSTVAEVITSGEASTTEELLAVAGQERVLLTTRTPLKDESGTVIGLVTLSRDITERNLAEMELRVERERLTLAADVSGLAVLDYHPCNGSLISNDELQRFFKIPSDEITLDRLVAAVHPDDRALFRAILEGTAGDIPTEQTNLRLLAGGDRQCWFTAASRVISTGSYDEDGTRVLTVIYDVTETNNAAIALRQSYASLQRAERLARVGSWTIDPETEMLYLSDTLCEMNQIPNGSALSVADLAQATTPEDFARLHRAIRNCLENGTPYMVDVLHFTPDGGRFSAEVRGEPVYDANGKLTMISGTLQDVSLREAARIQMAAIADSLPNGAIYRIDFLSPEIGLSGDAATETEMVLSYISAGIEPLIGYSADAVAANPSLLVRSVHPEDRDRYLEASRLATLAQTNFECDFRVIRPDGTTAWLQVRSAPRLHEGGRVWDGIILDVTRAYETAEALRHAKEAAEAAERAKADFLATMSHEIRTPMNAVIGMTRLAMQTDLSPRQQNYLEKIDTSARVLLGIINDILDFSRIEAGAIDLEDIDFTLESVLETLSNATSLKAEEKGLEVIYAIAPEVARTMRGDPLRLGQILINLVGNAVKFTQKGEILVSVDTAGGTNPQDPRLLRFSVRDTGIGLEPEQMSMLFRPFAQADNRTARRFGGTGLGLSISKKLVDLMGGEISVESRKGEGSTFSFTIALNMTLSPKQRLAQAFQDKRALIVDDIATSRETLSAMIAQFGVTAQTASSGPEALAILHDAAARGKAFDVVLMDWRMPGMDGVETARHIRSDKFLRDTPAVLMVTAHAGEEIIRNVDTLELQGLLIKPVTESVLFNAIQPIFDSRQLKVVPANEILVSHQRHPAILRGSRVLVVDDNLFNLEVATDFLELAGVHVTTAESGFEALDQLEAKRFDAVLMDMQMPEMDGLETTKRIREIQSLRDLPVIALTAQARVEDREATLLVGMAAHLTKPIDESLLYSTLASVLDGQMTPMQLAAPEPEPEIATPAIDLAKALERVRGDRQRLDRMLDLFLRDFAECPNQLRDALEAKDAKALGAVAHRVRGVAGYFGADQMFKHAETLELAIYNGETEDLKIHTGKLVASLEAVLVTCRRALDDAESLSRDPVGG
ncbi:PAS domain S-box protein [Paracoccus cavernae]|uniref:PAS domain S-box protein n=2 Tax=Paracoccus cavernae TaxID=1571207 RepID=UPI0035F4AF22